MSGTSVLSDADLHGLVDGHIDPDRRANVLRRAAASQRDRELIEAWQDQNDMIRAAFAGVEREPLPRSLDLRTPPQLHVIPLAAPAAATSAKPAPWRNMAVAAATVAMVVAGLAGSWYIAGLPADDERGPTARVTDEERVLANRTVGALAFNETDGSITAPVAEPPPTAAIPDLSNAGFTFIGAQTRGVSPKSVIFLYRNALDDRVAIGVSRAVEGDAAPVERTGGYIWHRRNVAYAIFGTVGGQRLRALAASLDAGGGAD